jgi:dienelactone hydrolase
MNGRMMVIRAMAALTCMAFAAPAARAQTPRQDAARAMEAWTKLVDEGRYEESWQGAAAIVRERVPLPMWEGSLRQARGSLGTVTGRTLEAAEVVPAPPGAPAGEWVRMRFAVTFANGAAATETVVALGSEGEWRPVGYFMAPRTQASDYAAPAGAPYTAEEVTVNAGNHTLAGTLTLPKDARGRVPAVVLITGSGAQDRDSHSPLIPEYRFFRQVADTLSRRGIAVLRMDDQGWGASKGDPSAATTADFADDIRAGIAFLRTRPEIDPGRIGLAGHSEGAIIAPLIAAGDPRIRTVVLLAGPSRTGNRIVDFQVRDALIKQGLAGAALDSAFAVAVAGRAAVAEIPWIRWFLEHDPLPVVRQVRAPVLILQGATDRQVTPDQAPELEAAIRAGGNRDVTVRVFPGLNHLFLHDPEGTADPALYARLPEKRVPAEVLGTLADWLAQRLR